MRQNPRPLGPTVPINEPHLVVPGLTRGLAVFGQHSLSVVDGAKKAKPRIECGATVVWEAVRDRWSRVMLWEREQERARATETS